MREVFRVLLAREHLDEAPDEEDGDRAHRNEHEEKSGGCHGRKFLGLAGVPAFAGTMNHQRREAGEEQEEEGRQAGDAAGRVAGTADKIQDGVGRREDWRAEGEIPPRDILEHEHRKNYGQEGRRDPADDELENPRDADVGAVVGLRPAAFGAEGQVEDVNQ